MKSWTLDVKEAPNGDKFIELNDEILAETGWKEGDNIRWIDRGDGSFAMEKIMDEENELVLVEAISIFRMRYVVEVPKGNKEWALDTVTMNEAKEFSQEHISEDIVSHRIINTDEFKRLCDEDNTYLKTWTDEEKLEKLVTWRKDYE